MKDFERVGSEMYPKFYQKFPKFFDSIRTVEMDRLEEVVEIMHMILEKMDAVKRGEMTHTEMRTLVFEKDLAQKYVKEKKK